MIFNRIASYLEHNSWVLNLFFIVMGTYFVAGAVNVVVASQIREVPSVTDRDKAGFRRSGSMDKQARVDFVSMASRNLFGIKRENLNPALEESPASPDHSLGSVDMKDIRSCSLPVSVRATLLSANNPEWSMAVIYNNSKRETNVYSIREGSNQVAAGATLITIGNREIIVQRGEHLERCLADADDKNRGKMSPRANPLSSESSRTSSSGGGVDKISETEYNIEKEEIDRVLGNLSAVATKARIVPSFKNGKPNGFKLFSIKPGSIYSKIGLKNGDVIQKVNGYEMNSPDKALEIYQKLKSAQNVTVDLQRRGRSMTMNYSIGR